MIDALFDLLGTFYQSGNFEQAEWIARSILLARVRHFSRAKRINGALVAIKTRSWRAAKKLL